jgi:glycosyltransferase involved in cell wall biosynthesis
MNNLRDPNFVVGEWCGREAAASASGPTSAVEGTQIECSSQRHCLPTLSCVIPCRNEAQNLDRLLPLLSVALAGCSPAWEVIVVDDGSTDSTPSTLSNWAQIPGFRVIQLSRNFGKEAALTAGLQACAGDVVVMMDADLQHPPALIPTFIQRWQEGHDVVYASRVGRDDESWFKRYGAGWFYALINAKGRFEVPADAGDFRLMDRQVVDALLSLPERNRFMKGLYAWVGFDSVGVPYTPDERMHGRSHFNPLRLVGLSLDGLTAFTTWPLRAVSAMGCVLALLAFLYGGYLTASYLLYGRAVSGWTTIVMGMMLFAGIQLLSLGVVGEYIARIFAEVKGRPLFVIKREIGQGLNTAGGMPSTDASRTETRSQRHVYPAGGSHQPRLDPMARHQRERLLCRDQLGASNVADGSIA